jgi:hypothetical protein
MFPVRVFLQLHNPLGFMNHRRCYKSCLSGCCHKPSPTPLVCMEYLPFGMISLLQKRFVVSAVKLFFVSVSSADTILRIQKIDYFSYRLFPADTQNWFSKKKKNRSPDLGTLGPDRALLVDARRGRRCCRISSGLRRAVGESRPSRSWSSGASLATGAVGAPRLPRAVGPHRLDRRVLLAAAEHHLRLASDWSRRCHRLRPEPPRTPTWPSRFGRPL